MVKWGCWGLQGVKNTLSVAPFSVFFAVFSPENKSRNNLQSIRYRVNINKLARFAGVAPVKFSSAGKGKEQSSRQGNRQLHGLFYFLAVTMVSRPKNGMPNHPVFYDYYMRKIGEGKTKSQALVCIMRRLVNIVYGMMKNKTEYREPLLEKEQ